MSVPYLSPTVRGEALEKAHQIRSLRHQLRKDIKEGRITLQEILEKADDEIIGKMRVKYLLESLPNVGRAKAARAMDEIGIAALRRIQGLGERQKAELLQRFVIETAEKEAAQKADMMRQMLDKQAYAERKLAEAVRELARIAERQRRAKKSLMEAETAQETLFAEKNAAEAALADANAKAGQLLTKAAKAKALRNAAAAEKALNGIIAAVEKLEQQRLRAEKALTRAAAAEAKALQEKAKREAKLAQAINQIAQTENADREKFKKADIKE